MESGGFADYVNMPRSIGAVISRGLATLTELDTVYGAEDLYLMLEIISVDTHNERIAAEMRKDS